MIGSIVFLIPGYENVVCHGNQINGILHYFFSCGVMCKIKIAFRNSFTFMNEIYLITLSIFFLQVRSSDYDKSKVYCHKTVLPLVGGQGGL